MEKPIVIKIGTNVLSDEKGNIELDILAMIIDQIAAIHKSHKNIVIVTSGAIGVGMAQLGLAKKPSEIVQRQACAAMGQHILMMQYSNYFEKHSIKVAQILLSYDAFTNKRKSENLLNAIHELFKHNCIPIINENDVTSIDEIGENFGDNDMLSAMVAAKLDAQQLLILTNVDGLFDKNPNQNAQAKLITKVGYDGKNSPWILEGSSALGVGGMDAKVKAAQYATAQGCKVCIANGRKRGILKEALAGNTGTTFSPK